MLQMTLEFGSLLGVEGIEGVAAGEHVHVVGQSFHAITPMQSRILISPSRIRVFTVPSATPSSWATSG